ncbi:hypothetical protein IEE94_01125 [Yimella sp. cx-573]|nr:hypothetical protein [Yimella sp. cx-573]
MSMAGLISPEGALELFSTGPEGQALLTTLALESAQPTPPVDHAPGIAIAEATRRLQLARDGSTADDDWFGGAAVAFLGSDGQCITSLDLRPASLQTGYEDHATFAHRALLPCFWTPPTGEWLLTCWERDVCLAVVSKSKDELFCWHATRFELRKTLQEAESFAELVDLLCAGKFSHE